jgi:hypothetical protein
MIIRLFSSSLRDNSINSCDCDMKSGEKVILILTFHLQLIEG